MCMCDCVCVCACVYPVCGRGQVHEPCPTFYVEHRGLPCLLHWAELHHMGHQGELGGARCVGGKECGVPLQAVLGSLGGVELLFPILEQVALPVMKRLLDEDTPTTPADTITGKPPLEGGWFGGKLLTKHPHSYYSNLYTENEGVAAFLKLLIAMLTNNSNNQSRFFHGEGPATIAALLMKTPPTLLTVSAFHIVQELVELFNRDDDTRADVHKHLVFDFRVWARPAYSVRIGEGRYHRALWGTVHCGHWGHSGGAEVYKRTVVMSSRLSWHHCFTLV